MNKTVLRNSTRVESEIVATPYVNGMVSGMYKETYFNDYEEVVGTSYSIPAVSSKKFFSLRELENFLEDNGLHDLNYLIDVEEDEEEVHEWEVEQELEDWIAENDDLSCNEFLRAFEV